MKAARAQKLCSATAAAMPKSYIKRILDARIYDVATETPLEQMRQLSYRFNNRILLKREDLQPVFSFKVRGAYNKLLQLPGEQRARGVIAASAGNHAQGLALGAAQLGVRATIVMPKTTPQIKVNAVRMRGAEVVLYGDTFDEAAAHAKILVEERGLTFVHPYDDPDVIAGQGTVAMELLRQHPGNLDAVFIPVGGGGLAAGMAAYIKYVRPEVKVYAVEPEDAACLNAALEAGQRVRLPQVGLFADGVAVAQIGEETFRVLRETVDGVITVTTDEICAAIKDIFEDTRSIAEPAGAVGLAGLKKYAEETGSRNAALATVCSGANTNFDRLRYISERTEIGEKREAVLAVTIPERPGSYLQFCRDLGDRAITEFNYRYANSGEAHIFVGLQVATDTDRHQLVERLQASGYRVSDLTENEMAKLHIRHLVGGRAPGLTDEVVYRFEFPERPGALRKFLEQLAGRWNITLFHYRNHGAAYGRVLAGMQVAPEERGQLMALLNQLQFPFWDETDNPAYRFFLAS
ncbi:threonine ammonia-lyase, biosynthetic [Microbulbifer thermotolerans]|uniref:L-threonine dehydratase n=2 Tax=Microbulbifer thermotolerans TaxID=252514 RepID=A0AB35HV05_MICTH|nr:threonine ammonia-lyase, biosynthetic [Microbulbifer thermotolerans]MCX2778194.1 threonine ammonia-lyase, biosynthetic [Microbulbifer thermotolerans]MCX2782172.1 threonine ammonia-lyase, biosynthetic [Microbulbifer thermotolerans]MCX2795264.1 threonine ammonia-lyase, biosynthetic [Microbulbifer thermotolerans]MCX2801174.1 threonine ammonia-lyase, biosynthetic [Microbulbifer thermotolerans]MCX2804542.1 threonine ammonia-lyase, biosynthetic [Microbulbifer thermotolerans]